MGFARASLSIGEEGGIMALEDRLHKMGRSFIELLLLPWVVDVVESEYFLLVVLPLYIY